MLSIKKGDIVKVLAGRDRGKTGRVIEVDRDRNRLLVENVNMVKRHLRPNPAKNIKGGILAEASPIQRSLVMLLCPTCGPIRAKAQLLPEGQKVRACRKCGNTMGQQEG